jgi:hypothetical protein
LRCFPLERIFEFDPFPFFFGITGNAEVRRLVFFFDDGAEVIGQTGESVGDSVEVVGFTVVKHP